MCLGRSGIFPFSYGSALVMYVQKASNTEDIHGHRTEEVCIWINHLTSSFLAIVSQKKLHIILQRTNDD